MDTRNARKMAVSLLALGGATAAIVFGSWAAWTAATTNPGNAITSGELKLGSDKDGDPVLTTDVTSVQPGDSGSDTVTITNTGSVPMTVKLTQSNANDDISDGTDNVMRFTIFDQTTGDCVYPAGTGACPDMSTPTTGGAWIGMPQLDVAGEDEADWAAGEAHTFVVAWEFTDSGTVNNAKNQKDNVATFDLAWDGTPA